MADEKITENLVQSKQEITVETTSTTNTVITTEKLESENISIDNGLQGVESGESGVTSEINSNVQTQDNISISIKNFETKKISKQTKSKGQSIKYALSHFYSLFASLIFTVLLFLPLSNVLPISVNLPLTASSLFDILIDGINLIISDTYLAIPYLLVYVLLPLIIIIKTFANAIFNLIRILKKVEPNPYKLYKRYLFIVRTIAFIVILAPVYNSIIYSIGYDVIFCFSPILTLIYLVCAILGLVFLHLDIKKHVTKNNYVRTRVFNLLSLLFVTVLTVIFILNNELIVESTKTRFIFDYNYKVLSVALYDNIVFANDINFLCMIGNCFLTDKNVLSLITLFVLFTYLVQRLANYAIISKKGIKNYLKSGEVTDLFDKRNTLLDKLFIFACISIFIASNFFENVNYNVLIIAIIIDFIICVVFKNSGQSTKSVSIYNDKNAVGEENNTAKKSVFNYGANNSSQEEVKIKKERVSKNETFSSRVDKFKISKDVNVVYSTKRPKLKEIVDGLYYYLIDNDIKISKESVGSILASLISNNVILLNTTNSSFALQISKKVSEFFNSAYYMTVIDEESTCVRDIIFETNVNARYNDGVITGILQSNVNEKGLTIVTISGASANSFEFLNIFADALSQKDEEKRFLNIGETPKEVFCVANGKLSLGDHLKCFIVLGDGEKLNGVDISNLTNVSIVNLVETKEQATLDYPYELMKVGKTLDQNLWIDQVCDDVDNYYLSEDLWRLLDEFEKVLNDKYGLSFDNKLANKIEEFVCMYLVCEATTKDALDRVLSQVILPYLFTNGVQIEELQEIVDKIFHLDNVPFTQSVLAQIIVKE